jgi:hypothetical protein
MFRHVPERAFTCGKNYLSLTLCLSISLVLYLFFLKIFFRKENLNKKEKKILKTEPPAIQKPLTISGRRNGRKKNTERLNS